MLMPDVLALPLEKARIILEQVGLTCSVVLTQPPRLREDEITDCKVTEYVVRQRLLDDNKVALVTVKRYRKEVLEDGSCN